MDFIGSVFTVQLILLFLIHTHIHSFISFMHTRISTDTHILARSLLHTFYALNKLSVFQLPIIIATHNTVVSLGAHTIDNDSHRKLVNKFSVNYSIHYKWNMEKSNANRLKRMRIAKELYVCGRI